MVNIGGRSKGCSTCRRRRIKCDETRPVCLKCQRQGLACDGPRETTFVQAAIVRSRRKAEASSTGLPNSEASAGSSSALVQTSPQTSLVAGNPEDYYVMFARKQLEPEGPIDTALQQLQSRNLALQDADPTIEIQSSHLRTVQSFATILFGMHHKQTEITQQGLIKHGATLRHLNQVLSQPNCWSFDEVLVSVTTLAVQETLIPTAPTNYLNHLVGIDRLLSLRDPRIYCSPSSLDLYKCLRHIILFGSLRSGKASVLARPEWKAVLRQTCRNDDEEQESELYDILADCSVLIAERNQLLHSSPPSPSDTSDAPTSLTERAKELYNQLHIWRQKWDADEKNTYIETFPAPTIQELQPMEEDDITFETSLLHTSQTPTDPPLSDMTFLNPLSPLHLLLYDTTTLYTLRLLIALLPDAEQHTYIAAQRATLEELCRCIPVYTAEQKTSAEVHASPVVHWAAQIAGEMLRDDESVWAGALRGVLDRKGAGVLGEGLG